MSNSYSKVNINRIKRYQYQAEGVEVGGRNKIFKECSIITIIQILNLPIKIVVGIA